MLVLVVRRVEKLDDYMSSWRYWAFHHSEAVSCFALRGPRRWLFGMRPSVIRPVNAWSPRYPRCWITIHKAFVERLLGRE